MREGAGSAGTLKNDHFPFELFAGNARYCGYAGHADSSGMVAGPMTGYTGRTEPRGGRDVLAKADAAKPDSIKVAAE
jgi:hypothetical protein